MSRTATVNCPKTVVMSHELSDASLWSWLFLDKQICQTCRVENTFLAGYLQDAARNSAVETESSLDFKLYDSVLFLKNFTAGVTVVHQTVTLISKLLILFILSLLQGRLVPVFFFFVHMSRGEKVKH